jgi:hypothetical protein
MGYLIGGKIKIYDGSDTEFRNARNVNSGIGSTRMTEVPMIKPARGLPLKSSASLNQFSSNLGSGLDVERNAPMFNDPRYTSSTLAINNIVAFQGNLN